MKNKEISKNQSYIILDTDKVKAMPSKYLKIILRDASEIVVHRVKTFFYMIMKKSLLAELKNRLVYDKKIKLVIYGKDPVDTLPTIVNFFYQTCPNRPLSYFCEFHNVVVPKIIDLLMKERNQMSKEYVFTSALEILKNSYTPHFKQEINQIASSIINEEKNIKEAIKFMIYSADSIKEHITSLPEEALQEFWEKTGLVERFILLNYYPQYIKYEFAIKIFQELCHSCAYMTKETIHIPDACLDNTDPNDLVRFIINNIPLDRPSPFRFNINMMKEKITPALVKDPEVASEVYKKLSKISENL